jgi:thioredoxin 1
VITDSNFEQGVLKSQQAVLVDFWAPWCAPCHAIAPILDELAEEYAGKVVIARINVDENPKTSSKYGIQAIPTLLLFKEGKPLRQIVGLKPKKELKQILDTAVA